MSAGHLVRLLLLFFACGSAAAENFASGDQSAVQFGVYEVALTSSDKATNPFDVQAEVTFVPPSGARNAKTAAAFYDGGDVWRARVYVSEPGSWTWSSTSRADLGLGGQSGRFQAVTSRLRGRLLPHPRDARQWITEDGRWFLHLSDTAYFLLCAHDGNGAPVTDEAAERYARNDAARGITALRCFLTGGEAGFQEGAGVWRQWFFTDDTSDHLRLDHLQCADRRLRMLLEKFPDMAVQLILFPLAGYKTDDRFWAALLPAQRERLLRHLVARYAAYPQLYWLIMNDAHFGEGFPRSNALAREAGTYLQEHDPWQHPRSIGHARRLPFVFGAEEWTDYIHIEHEHDLGALEMGRYAALNKPVFLGEDRYEHDHGPRRDPTHMQAWQRRLFWAWLLSGGSANYGGRWWTVQPYAETGALAATFHQRPQTTFTQALTGLDSVKAIRDYFEQRKIDLGDFSPAHALAGDPNGPNAPRVMRRGDAEFLIYHPNALESGQNARPDPKKTACITLDLNSVVGNFAVEWYRAEDGTDVDGGIVKGGQSLDFTAPWLGQDVVLRLAKPGKARR